MTGAPTLADYPEAMVRIACRKCDRRGQYRLATVKTLYGEKARLPDVLAHLAHDCPKRNAIGNEACGAYFPGLAGRYGARTPSAGRSAACRQPHRPCTSGRPCVEGRRLRGP